VVFLTGSYRLDENIVQWMSDMGFGWRQLEAQLPNLRRYAWALTRDSGRADDLVQACLVRALDNQHRWRENTDLRAWLCTILHNLFISDIRRQVREQDHLQRLNIRPAVMPGTDPELSYQVREVERHLKRMPTSQRQIVLQIGLEQELYCQVAADLGIPIGTVRSRLGRARENLRALTGRPPGKGIDHRAQLKSVKSPNTSRDAMCRGMMHE
jgi:RNA polymerase sigma-70 factor (ECF subfamily)